MCSDNREMIDIIKRAIDMGAEQSTFRFNAECNTPKKLIIEIFNFYSDAYRELSRDDLDATNFILNYIGYRGIIDNIFNSAIKSYPYIFTSFSVISEYSKPNSYYIFDNNYSNYSKEKDVAYYNIWFEIKDNTIHSYIEAIPYKKY